MSPSTTRNTELPKTALLFTLPVKEQANPEWYEAP